VPHQAVRRDLSELDLRQQAWLQGQFRPGLHPRRTMSFQGTIRNFRQDLPLAPHPLSWSGTMGSRSGSVRAKEASAPRQRQGRTAPAWAGSHVEPAWLAAHRLTRKDLPPYQR
jgi:hypothetical protein